MAEATVDEIRQDVAEIIAAELRGYGIQGPKHIRTAVDVRLQGVADDVRGDIYRRVSDLLTS